MFSIGNIANGFAIYFGQFLLLFAPLLVLPRIASVLDPVSLGTLFFFQSLSGWMLVVQDFGFSISGTREVAQARGTPERLAGTFSRILSIRLALAACVAVASLAMGAFLHLDRDTWGWLSLACAWSTVRVLNPNWFLWGLGNFVLPSVFSSISRLAFIGLVLVLVRPGTDPRLPFLLELLVSGSETFLLGLWVIRLVPEVRVSFLGVVEGIRRNMDIFVVTLATSVYTVANVFLFGLVASKDQIAIYGGADKVHKGLVSIFTPVIQLLFPQISHDVVHAPGVARRNARKLLIVVVCCGAVLMLGTFAFSSWIIRTLLGSSFDNSAPILNVLALQLPVTAATRVLGVNWLLAWGKDRDFRTASILAGAVNLLLVFVLASKFGVYGMSVAFVATEIFVLCAFIYLTIRHRVQLWGKLEMPPVA